MYGGLHTPQPLPSEDALVVLARDFTPRVEVIRSSLLLLDLKGLGRLWPTPESLGEALLAAAHERCREPHVALASTRPTALVVARAQPGLTVVPLGKEADALAPLPLSLLDLAGEHAALLRRWGLTTIGDLAALPAKGLAERLGAEGPRLRRLARGEEESVLVPTVTPEPCALTLDLDWPVDGLEPLAFVLMQALEPLCRGLTQRARRAAALSLRLKLADGSWHERTLRPAAPSAEPRTWRTLLLLDLEAHPPADAVLGLSVHAELTPARPAQYSLLERARAAPERLAETFARLHAWSAPDHVGSPLLLDTHRPQAFALVSFDPPSRRDGAARPPRAYASLRVFRPPQRVTVTLRDGAPAFIRGAVRGPVVDHAGPWRASGDWWDEAWSREEWDVALASGGVYRLFLDRLRGEWFVEGEVD